MPKEMLISNGKYPYEKVMMPLFLVANGSSKGSR